MANNQTREQFYNLFIEILQDMYSAEEQLAEAMPKYIEAIGECR